MTKKAHELEGMGDKGAGNARRFSLLLIPLGKTYERPVRPPVPVSRVATYSVTPFVHISSGAGPSRRRPRPSRFDTYWLWSSEGEVDSSFGKKKKGKKKEETGGHS